jgi:hypothetical protein
MPTAYISVSDADNYFATERLHADAWSEATTADKQKALYEATRLIDTLRFAGIKADSSQELEFPRFDDTVVPDGVQKACCEIALALLDGVDIETEMQLTRAIANGFTTVRTTYDSGIADVAKVHGIPSQRAWNFLLPYLKPARDIRLRRTS